MSRRLLGLVRQLGSENERSKAEVRAEMTAEWNAREAALRAEAADQRHLVSVVCTATSLCWGWGLHTQVLVINTNRLL